MKAKRLTELSSVAWVTLFAGPFLAGFSFLVAAAPWEIGFAAGARYCGTMTGFGAATASLGGFFGFLFGVPRRTGSHSPGGAVSYSGNTNLESISDWLTKVIVGVSLVEARQLKVEVSNFAKWASANMGIAVTPGVVWCVGTFSFIVGFALVYVFVRSRLPVLLRDAEQKASSIGNGGSPEK